MSTEHQDGRESDNRQRDVIEFPRSIGAAIEDNRDNENEHATRERGARFDQPIPALGHLTSGVIRLVRDPSSARFDAAEMGLGCAHLYKGVCIKSASAVPMPVPTAIVSLSFLPLRI